MGIKRQRYVSEHRGKPCGRAAAAARLGTASATACIGLAALVTPAAAGVTAARPQRPARA